MLTYHKTKGMFWIRLFGTGLMVKNIKIHPLLFSQRYGYVKGIKIGKYWIQFLKRNKC